MIRPLRDRDPTPPDPGPAIDAAIAHILDEVDYDPLAGHVVARVEVEVEPADILAAFRGETPPGCINTPDGLERQTESIR